MSEVKCVYCNQPLAADDHVKGCPTLKAREEWNEEQSRRERDADVFISRNTTI